MPNKQYEDTTGKVFSTQQEAAASNTALGTNPSTSGAISSASLQPVTEIKIPQTKPSTQVDGTLGYLGETATQNQDAYTQQQTQQLETAKAGKDQSLSALLQQMQAPGETQLTNQALEDTGANTAQKEVQALNSQLLAEQRGLENQLRALEKNPEGLFGGALGQEMNRVKGESLQRQADIAVVLNAKQGQFEIAKQIADRAVQARMEVQRNRLNTLQLIYQDNKDSFTKAEQRQFETMQADRERKFAMDTYQEKARFDQMIQQNDPLYQAKLKEATGGGGDKILSISDAKALGVPYGTTRTQAAAMGITPGAQEEGTYRTKLAATGREAVFGLLNIAEASPGIFGKTAALPLPDFVRSDAFRNYKAQLDFLKGNIIPAALTAMREASKTGGALGQVSDREGAWLASSLGALEMTQSPEQVKAQLKAIDAHLTTWQSAVAKYGGGGFVTTAPDGTQIEIID